MDNRAGFESRIVRRRAGVADRACFENKYGGNVIRGSNPLASALCGTNSVPSADTPLLQPAVYLVVL